MGAFGLVRRLRAACWPLALLLGLLAQTTASAVVLDGGVDPANLGKGEWVYILSAATNRLNGYVPTVFDVPSLMSYFKDTLGLQYIVVKAGDDGTPFPSTGTQFTAGLVTAAHAQGLKIFGYTRCRTDASGILKTATNVINCGADGFILDAEDEWTANFGSAAASTAWAVCGTYKTNWPTKFLGHSPICNISGHSSFPYKEFGYWCDAVMPQVYWVQWGKANRTWKDPLTGQYYYLICTPAAAIDLMDAEWRAFQNSLSGTTPLGTPWTNAIKPLVPIGQADTPGATDWTGAPNQTYADMVNFVSGLATDPGCVTAGGYKGVCFFAVGESSGYGQDTGMLAGIAAASFAPLPVSISGQPISTTANAGTTVTFQVVAGGTGPLHYSWRRNGTPLSDGSGITGSGMATLTIGPVFAASAGTYTVMVTNSFSSATSASATLVVIDPAINSQPPSQTLLAGSVATFTVNATGTGTLSYQWRKDGTSIEGATASSYSIPNVQPSDAGSYSVTVNGLLSETATLTVVVPVSISTQPQSQQVAQSSNITLSVVASGTAPLAYQWCFNEVPLVQGTASTLVISNAQAGNAGTYSVLVTNPLSSLRSSNAVLQVDLFPIITSQPESRTVYFGDNVSFSVGNDAVLPVVSSGTLQLWLKADAGVLTNSNGQVTQWQDQSPNANHANAYLAFPALTNSTLLNYRSVLRFFGGDRLVGRWPVPVPDAFTSFMVYSLRDISGKSVPMNFGSLVTGLEGPPQRRCKWFDSGRMGFTTESRNFSTSLIVPTNTCHIWTDRMNSNRTSVELFDTTATTNKRYPFTASEAPFTGWSYSVGGASGTIENYDFPGDIGEFICFQGALSETDRLAVEQYLKTKYFGSPEASTLTYQWQFNGANIAGATNSTLQLYNAQPSAAGIYVVLVSQGGAVTRSSNAVLNVLSPPVFVTQPASQAVVTGADATFTVTVTGNEPLSYQWTFNGADLPGATNSAFTRTSVVSEDVGSYTVRVANAFGIVTSSNAVLTVLLPPAIITQPSSQTVWREDSASFSVVASGTLPLQYEWSRNGTVLGGATDSVYNLSAAQFGDAGSYFVKVSNPYGKTNSAIALLTVNPFFVPAVTGQPQSQVIVTGSNAVFTAGVAGTSPLNCQWWNGAAALVDGPSVLGSSTPELMLRSVTATNAGAYYLVVTNHWGCATSAVAALTVISAPAISTPPTNVSAVVGAPAIFSVGATGGALSYQWRRGTTNLVENAAIAGARSASLTLLKTRIADGENDYSVMISNVVGSVTSSPVTLTVLRPPWITKQPSNTETRIGQSVILPVQAQGTGLLSYRWRRGTNWLVDGGNIAGATTANVTLRGITAVDLGNYSVVITNQYGSITSRSALVKNPMSVTIDFPATGEFSRPSVLVAGTAADPYVSLSKVLYQLNGGIWKLANGRSVWTALITLQPGTNVFAVKSVNADGFESVVARRSYFLKATSCLSLTTSGVGTVAGAANGQWLLIGKFYTVKAIPGTGYVFTNWTGTVTSTNAVLPFLMQSGMVLRANFVPIRAAARSSIYNGLFYETTGVNHERSGFVTIATTSVGAFSGKLNLAGVSRSFSGTFGADAQTSVVLAGSPEVSLNLNLDRDEESIGGQVSGRDWTARLLADRADYASRAISNRSVALLGRGGPGGDGFANLIFQTNGAVILNGKLPDNTPFSMPATYVSRSGNLPVYVPLYGGNGSLLGWLSNRDDVYGGQLSWSKTTGYAARGLTGFECSQTNEVMVIEFR